MKAALLILLAVLSLADFARASGAPAIDIITTEAGVSYIYHDYNRRLEKHPKTLDEIETWLRADLEEAKEAVIIRPDARTSFKAVLDVLLRLKAAGVKWYIVMNYEGEVTRSVVGNTDKIEERESAPSGKKK